MTYRWQLPTLETHGRLPSEDEEQQDFVRWFRKTHEGVLLHSIPNEGKRTRGNGVNMKCLGLLKGMPDLHVPKWNLWIEMKAIGGALKKEQREVHAELRAIGDTVITCWGSLAAQRAISSFLGSKFHYGELPQEWR